MIHFQNATKQYADGTMAVDDLTLSIPKGQFCVLLGASGAGKSTVLKMVNGLVTPTSGHVEFEGTRVEPSTLAAVRPRIGMVHQQFNLVLRSTILRNVLAGALPSIPLWRAMFAAFPLDLQRKACGLLQQVGLDERHLCRRASQLSGGQQQRVAIARAFILDPTLVLADEPVASLDPEISRDILELLKRASCDHDATVMCSLHQLDLAREFADRIVGFANGRMVFDGAPHKLDEATVRHIYGSRSEEPAAAAATATTSIPTPDAGDVSFAATEVA